MNKWKCIHFHFKLDSLKRDFKSDDFKNEMNIFRTNSDESKNMNKQASKHYIQKINTHCLLKRVIF